MILFPGVSVFMRKFLKWHSNFTLEFQFPHQKECCENIWIMLFVNLVGKISSCQSYKQGATVKKQGKVHTTDYRGQDSSSSAATTLTCELSETSWMRSERWNAKCLKTWILKSFRINVGFNSKQPFCQDNLCSKHKKNPLSTNSIVFHQLSGISPQKLTHKKNPPILFARLYLLCQTNKRTVSLFPAGMCVRACVCNGIWGTVLTDSLHWTLL